MTQKYTLYIDAYSPDTIPMHRLAEYMQRMSTMMGNHEAVHFDTLLEGSTQLATKVDSEHVPKMITHFTKIKDGAGSPSALKAMQAIDRLLEEDNASGFVYEGTDHSAQIIQFPGINKIKNQTFGPFNQEGTLDGTLISVGGADETAHIQLQNGDIKYTGLTTDRETARRLAKYIYEPLRVIGVGRWFRDESASWVLKKFTISDFEALNSDDLLNAVEKLRDITGSCWDSLEDPMQELETMRRDDEGLH